MIKNITLIIKNSDFRKDVEEIKFGLEKRGITASIWDTSSPELQASLNLGPTMGEMITIAFSFSLGAITSGVFNEIGKDIYAVIKDFAKKLIKKNNTKSIRESLMITVEIKTAPEYWYHFRFYADSEKEVLRAAHEIPNVLLGIESTREMVNIDRKYFVWHEGSKKWSFQFYNNKGEL